MNNAEQKNRIIPNAQLPVVGISLTFQGRSNRNLHIPLLPGNTFTMEGRRLSVYDQYKNLVQTIIPPDDDLVTVIPMYNMPEDDAQKGK